MNKISDMTYCDNKKCPLTKECGRSVIHKPASNSLYWQTHFAPSSDGSCGYKTELEKNGKSGK